MARLVCANRRQELLTMRRWFSRRRAGFIAEYGKRRTRKNILSPKFMENTDGIHFFCRIKSQKEMLEQFSLQIAGKMGMESLKRALFATWDRLLDFFIEKKTVTFTILFDEFPYLVSANPARPSICQDYRDRKIGKPNLNIRICGSSIYVMESLIEYNSSLYGRRTAQINVCQRDLRL